MRGGVSQVHTAHEVDSVLKEPGVTELPVLAAVPMSFEKWNWRDCWLGLSCQMGWYVRAAEVRVHGKHFEQTALLCFCCRSKML